MAIRFVARRPTLLLVLCLGLVVVLGGAPARGDSPEAEAVDHRLKASQKRMPAGEPRQRGRLASTRDAYREMWDHFRLKGERPRVNWRQRKVLFVTTGESSVCPMRFRTLRLNAETRTFRLRARSNRDECTDDWTPRTFVVALAHDAIPKGKLSARVNSERRIHVRRIR